MSTYSDKRELDRRMDEINEKLDAILKKLDETSEKKRSKKNTDEADAE